MKLLVIIHRFNAGDGYHYDPASTEKNYNYYLPSGLAYIIASLKKAGFDTDVLNLNHVGGTTEDAILDVMSETRYDIVYLGGVSLYYPNIRDIIKCLRYAASPRTKIVVGGGIITAQPELMFKMLEPDVAVIGEGEKTCVDIACAFNDFKPLKDVAGIVFDDRGIVHKTEPREPIIFLDDLPFPDYEAMGMKEFLDNTKCGFIYDHFDNPRPYPILASRSCPFKCTFCFHTVGDRYRPRSLDNIMEEVRYATEKYKINLFFFYDDLFAANENRVVEFCKRFKEYTATVDHEIKFTVELRVDSITPTVLTALKSAGCDTVCLGLESYSQTVLDSMQKHITPKQIRDALELITANKMTPIGNFIFGDPAETLETAKETLDFFRTRQDILHGVRVAFVIPFQGSKIYKDRVQGDAEEEVFVWYRENYPYDYHEPVNMTKLSGADFETLKDWVFTAHYTQGTYAVAGHYADGTTKAICPVCGMANHYPAYVHPGSFGMSNTGCRHCNARFELVGEHFWIVQTAIRTFGFNRLYRIRKLFGGKP